MVNFITSITLLLTAASSVVAVPHDLEARSDTDCMDYLGADALANVCPIPMLSKYITDTSNRSTMLFTASTTSPA
jgi:hypothetical protein